MLRTIRMILLVRLAMLTSGCAGVSEAHAKGDANRRVPRVEERYFEVDDTSVLKRDTSCPALTLAVFDRRTERTSEVNVPVGDVTAALRANEVSCRPAEDRVHVFSRASEWILPDADGRPRWLHVVDVDYDGTAARIQYVDPDAQALSTAGLAVRRRPASA